MRVAKGIAWVMVMAVLLSCLATLIYLYTAMDRSGASRIVESTGYSFGIHHLPKLVSNTPPDLLIASNGELADFRNQNEPTAMTSGRRL